MAQKFPKYRQGSNEPIAHEEINYNLRAVKDELGRLNEHNIKGNTFSDRTHVEAGFALHVNNDYTEFDPSLNFGDGTGNGDYPAETAIPPNPYSDDRITVDGSKDWQVIMTYTKFTGNSLLWALVSFQQQTYGPSMGDAPGGCYALRLNGTIIDETITGGTDRTNDPAGELIACQAYPYVLDFVIPVAPGNNTIELVGKAPTSGLVALNPFVYWGQISSDILAMVFNRELILITLDPESEAVDGSTDDFTPLVEGDTINAATLSDPFTDVAGDYNSIEYPSIQPNALTAEHCPSTVIAADQLVTGTLVTHTYTNEYPGYAVDTMGSPGWAVISDGTDDLELFLTPVDLTDTTIAGILVGVDVNVIQIYPDPACTTTSELTYCVIALQYRDDGGTWRTVGKTERYVNSEYDSGSGTQLVLRKNIGFRTLLTIDNVTGSGEVDGIRVVVSGFDRDSSATFTIELQQASLWYAVLQGDT